MKSSVLLAGVSLLTIGVGVSRLFQDDRLKGKSIAPPSAMAWPPLLSLSHARSPYPAEGSDATAETARAFLMYFVVPLWVAAGVADAACHRASDIETTSGPKESALHILMLAEVGIPLMAALFLEVTSPVLALLIASFLLHELTSLWDVSYATGRRNVTPIEHHVHSFLEMIPLMAVSMTAILHWKQFLSLIGIDRDPEDMRVALKKKPVPLLYSVTLIASVSLLEGVPYIAEFVRGLRANTQRRMNSVPGKAT